MGLKSKDLLGMKQLTPEEIMEILDTAKTMKMVVETGPKKTSHLQGKSVVTMFYENSTRTRLSFELASKYMGSTSANISASGSSVAKGESLLDTARTIDMMGTDIIIMRHPQSGALPGSLFIAFIAVMPALASLLNVQDAFSQFFGGTSLLILVGVVLDTLAQIESHLLMRHYDGLLSSGRIHGRGMAAY